MLVRDATPCETTLYGPTATSAQRQHRENPEQGHDRPLLRALFKPRDPHLQIAQAHHLLFAIDLHGLLANVAQDRERRNAHLHQNLREHPHLFGEGDLELRPDGVPQPVVAHVRGDPDDLHPASASPTVITIGTAEEAGSFMTGMPSDFVAVELHGDGSPSFAPAIDPNDVPRTSPFTGCLPGNLAGHPEPKFDDCSNLDRQFGEKKRAACG